MCKNTRNINEIFNKFSDEIKITGPQIINDKKEHLSTVSRQDFYRTSAKPRSKNSNRGRSKFHNPNSKLIEKPVNIKTTNPSTINNFINPTSTPFKIHYPDSYTVTSTVRPHETTSTYSATKEFSRNVAYQHPIPESNFDNQRRNSSVNSNQTKRIINNVFEPTTARTPSSTYVTPTIPFIRVQPKRNISNEAKTKLQRISQKFNFETLKYENIQAEQIQNVNKKPINNEPQIQERKLNPSYKTTDTVEPIKISTYNPINYSSNQNNQYYKLDDSRKSRFQQSANQIQPKNIEIRKESEFSEKPRPLNVSPKRFSTLVPRDYYNVTTFKPQIRFNTMEFKSINNLASTFETTSTTTAVAKKEKSFNKYYSSFSPSSTTLKPLADDEEDDGQYRPELYEKDFYRNRKLTKTTKVTTTYLRRNRYESDFQKVGLTTEKNSINSGEDELLKTENSQNIANSHNELRQNRNKDKIYQIDDTFDIKSSPKPFSKHEETTTEKFKEIHSKPTKTKNTHATSKTNEKANKDVSYDYQYYDAHDNDEHYPDYSVIEDFGRTYHKKH